VATPFEAVADVVNACQILPNLFTGGHPARGIWRPSNRRAPISLSTCAIRWNHASWMSRTWFITLAWNTSTFPWPAAP